EVMRCHRLIFAVVLAAFAAAPIAAKAVAAEDMGGSSAGKLRIMHSGIRVNDLDMMLDFYDKAFGMHEKRRRASSDGSMIEVFVGYTDDRLFPEMLLVGHTDPKRFPYKANPYSGAKTVPEMGTRMVLET